MEFRPPVLKNVKLKIIILLLIISSILLSTFISVNAGLFGEKIKKISGNELKEIKFELNLSKDPIFYSYTDSILKEAFDKEINSQETPGLTFGSFILNALYEEKLVEMCYPNFNDEESSLFFSKLADNLSDWQEHFTSKTTKLALQWVIEAYLKMPKLGIGTSTLFLAIDLVQIDVAMAKLAKVIARKALFYYLFNRSQGDSHEAAWGEGIPPLYDNWQTESFFQSLWNKYGEAILSDNLDNFKEEQYEFLRVLILQALNRPPDPPNNMIQFKSDGKTILKIGKTTTEKTIILKAKVSDPDGNKTRLQIELRRLDEYEGKFDEDKGGLQQSDLFENNSEIMIPIYELADGDYHWRARAIDEHNLASEWISFGGNPDSAVDFSLGQTVVAPIITSPLKITPASPYYVGDTINAEFTITNENTIPTTFSVLTVGGRNPDDQVADFTHRQNILLKPFESYNYQSTLTLNKVGDYHFFCAYQIPDGNWNTCINLGSGLVDEDRVEDIVVKEKEEQSTEEEVTEVSSSKDYFPLDEGKRWEYQVYVKEKNYLGFESKRSIKQVITNFTQRELRGKKVTPQKKENKEIPWGAIYTIFKFIAEDKNGIYQFAQQRPEDVEPKIFHDHNYIIKYPVKVGNSWQEIETSPLEPRIFIPIKSTIESIDEVVTVPAGTFKECLKIKSTGFAEKVLEDREKGCITPKKENVRIEKEYYTWFAPHVGRIKMIFKAKKTCSDGGFPKLPAFIEMTIQLETFK